MAVADLPIDHMLLARARRWRMTVVDSGMGCRDLAAQPRRRAGSPWGRVDRTSLGRGKWAGIVELGHCGGPGGGSTALSLIPCLLPPASSLVARRKAQAPSSSHLPPSSFTFDRHFSLSLALEIRIFIMKRTDYLIPLTLFYVCTLSPAASCIRSTHWPQ